MRNGIAGIRLIAGLQQFAVFGNDDGFDRRRAGINAEVYTALVAVGVGEGTLALAWRSRKAESSSSLSNSGDRAR